MVQPPPTATPLMDAMRFLDVAQRLKQLLRERRRIGTGWPPIRVTRPQIRSSTEGPPGPCQDNDTRLIVSVFLREHVMQLVDELHIERVQPIGTIEGHGGNKVVLAYEKCLVRHPDFPPKSELFPGGTQPSPSTIEPIRRDR